MTLIIMGDQQLPRYLADPVGEKFEIQPILPRYFAEGED